MIRQILACLVILLVAAIGWLFLVPGAPETLAKAGIILPFGPSVQETAAAGRPAGGPGARPGGGGGGPGARQVNVVTSAVKSATINAGLAAIGEGSAARSVTVVATSGGELAEVAVRPGQQVADTK